MLDQAGIRMSNGSPIAIERISGVNDNMYQAHYHNYFEIYFLEGGQRQHRLEATQYDMTAGGLALFPPYSMHYSYAKKDVPFQRLVLYFTGSTVHSETLLAQLKAAGGFYQFSSRDQLDIHESLKLLLSEQDRHERFHEEIELHILNMLLFRILRGKKKAAVTSMSKQDPISAVISYIHHHYSEELSINKLAELIYVSPYYLCRCFKKQTRLTITQYINQSRIMNAQRKFQETNKNVSTVCTECGFSSLIHFNRVFKSITGMTPSGYRKSIHVYSTPEHTACD